MLPSSPSTFDRVRASFFRDKQQDERSPTPNSKRNRLSLSRVFSTARPKSGDAPSPTSQPEAVAIPVNPRSSPVSTSHGPPTQSLDAAASQLPAPLPDRAASPAGMHDASKSIPDNVYSNTSPMDEREMKRRLMDIESSFMVDHVADTDTHNASFASRAKNIGTASQALPQTSAPPSSHEEDLLDYGDSTLPDLNTTEAMSSPSAEAAQRSKLRATGTAKPVQAMDNPVENNDALHKNSDPADDQDRQIERSQRDSGHERPSSPSRLHPTGRPGYLKNRQSSQRSSASSFLSNDMNSELGFGTEVGSGGATPGSHSTLRPSSDLPRMPSLGSIASSVSGHTEVSASRRYRKPTSAVNLVAQESNLGTLDEEKTRQLPDTPRNTVGQGPDPSNTVVNQHVRDVEVPATVARNYKASHLAPPTVSKTNGATPMFGRTKNELTLKEQNSRIDKLSKENFDLKLKIHYLYQALQDRSDEGVKDLIAKNATLQSDLVKIRKDNQVLRKRTKQLERELRGREDGASAVRSANPDESEDAMSSRSFRQNQLEEEIVYLRDRMQALEDENDRLMVEPASGKSTQGPQLKELSGAATQSGHTEIVMQIKNDLELERHRREQADAEVLELRAEVLRMKRDRSPVRGLRLRPSSDRLNAISQGKSVTSAEFPEGTSLSGTTIVDQLKHENAELRRDLGAQTSMLTSRNRERERLQQEIEDLKLVQRRGDLLSVSGDSIFDRSVSRQNQRPTSRASEATRASQMSNEDREQMEAREARLRDENAALRMRNQDLQQDLDMLSDGAEHLRDLRSERDEALQLIEEERDYAAETIDRLEEMLEVKERDIEQLSFDLTSRENESRALEQEIKAISESLNRVADDSESSQTAMQNLHQDLTHAHGEIEALEQNLKDATAAKERLEVQAESSQNEISFLREEQEGDKIKISDLQAALSRAKTNLRDEKARLQEIEGLETELRTAREETRRLRKALDSKNEEATTARESLDGLDRGLRATLGVADGNRGSLLKHVGRLQRDLRDARTRSVSADPGRVAQLEQALNDDRARLVAMEERYSILLRDRNERFFNFWVRLAALCGADWLKHLLRAQTIDAPTLESISSNPASIDLPLGAALDRITHTLISFRKRLHTMEKEMNRDFDALSYDLDVRSERLEALERAVSNGARIEKQGDSVTAAEIAHLKDENRLLRRELKILKQGAFALPGLPSPRSELESAAAAAKALERETAAFQARQGRPSTTPSVTTPTASHGTLTREHELTSLQRHNSSAAAPDSETASLAASSTAAASQPQGSHAGGNGANGSHPTLLPSEQRWILRLKELERRLKAEREARLLDRSGARKRLEEERGENEGLRRELELERGRQLALMDRGRPAERHGEVMGHSAGSVD